MRRKVKITVSMECGGSTVCVKNGRNEEFLLVKQIETKTFKICDDHRTMNKIHGLNSAAKQ